jgi:hypothetical protein
LALSLHGDSGRFVAAVVAASSMGGLCGTGIGELSLGKVIYALALHVLCGRIQTIRSVINPDKVRYVGPLADLGGRPRGEPGSPGPQIERTRRLRSRPGNG